MSTGFVLITLFLIIISFNFYDNPVNKLLSHLQVWKLIFSKVKSFAHVPSASKWWKQNLNPGFPGGAVVKNLPANAREAQDTRVRSLGGEDTPEKETAPHSSALAPWTWGKPRGQRSLVG